MTGYRIASAGMDVYHDLRSQATRIRHGSPISRDPCDRHISDASRETIACYDQLAIFILDPRRRIARRFLFRWGNLCGRMGIDCQYRGSHDLAQPSTRDLTLWVAVPWAATLSDPSFFVTVRLKTVAQASLVDVPSVHDTRSWRTRSGPVAFMKITDDLPSPGDRVVRSDFVRRLLLNQILWTAGHSLTSGGFVVYFA